MRLRICLSIALVAALVTAASSCAEDAQFTTRFTPDYPSAPHATISVFGVFKDGRMSAEAWDYFSPVVASGGADGGEASPACPAAFETALLARDMPLFTAVDSYARANGITEGLLEKFAQSAKGDLVMVITQSGKLPATGADGGASLPASQPPPQSGQGRGGMVGRRGSPGSTTGMRRVEPTDALELSAMLYSVHLHRSVGLVGMTYSGHSIDEAVKQFAQKLRATVPASPCAGWNEIHVDEAAIHDIQE